MNTEGDGKMAVTFRLTGIVIGIGFLVVSYGIFVNESGATLLAGLIVMDAGIIGWMIAACYVIVASLRKAFGNGSKATDQPSRPPQ